jgi:hypothetical protein
MSVFKVDELEDTFYCNRNKHNTYSKITFFISVSGLRNRERNSCRMLRVIKKEVYTLKKLFYKNYWR